MKLGGLFDLEVLKKKIEELQNKMQEPSFWSDIKQAQKITQEEK
jgi:peptide chain release factor 2